MISEDFARRQIARLSRLRNFPSRPEEELLRADLIAELRQAASEAEAEELVHAWLRDNVTGEAPTVADLYRLIQRAQASEGDRPLRQPGDEPFHGLTDLIDARIREALARRADHGTAQERKDLLRFLEKGSKRGQCKHL